MTRHGAKPRVKTMKCGGYVCGVKGCGERDESNWIKCFKNLYT